MDVLLRRFTKVASGVKTIDHLDADELNAFAEGGLPPAARSRYISHLADCDDCRRAVTELAAASGRVESMAVPASQPTVTESWWQKVGTFFATARLRYAAFAAVLLAVVGIGFALWRETPSDLLVPNRQAASEKVGEASQPQEPAANGVAPGQSPAVAKAIPQPMPAAPYADQKHPETTAVSPPPPAKPADALARNDTASSAARGAAEPSANAVAPSYAPPPAVATERADTRNREQQNLEYMNGPQRAESNEKYKSLDDRSRGAGDFAKARDEDRARSGSDQPVAKEENKDERGAARKRSPERTAALASRPAAAERQEESKSDKAAPPEEADTRSVGGREFKRQGNTWVDTKLKTSMSIKPISRGSDDFERLDSGLRSIAQQFSGPVVVVWKGKAYRIQ